ncbi:MAG: alpha amylase C-terminal domain-containing protein, partial [Bacteroidaceae bacterium]|nr:alpha amylase C-terminal domain-containing protein [Bacteroidaceae bacterium]
FLPVKQQNVVAFQLKDHAAGDVWEQIVVVFNSNPKDVRIDVPQGVYTVVCRNGEVNEDGLAQFKGAKLTVPAQSALIMYK